MKLKVLKPFRDIVDKDKRHQVNDTLVVDDLNRVNDLVSRGICIIVDLNNDEDAGDKVKIFDKEFDMTEAKEALLAIGITVAHNAGVTSISKKLTELTDEQNSALKEILLKD